MPDLDSKRAEARSALAGADWTAKREREAKLQALASEEAKWKSQLTASAKEKETLELAWIELDNQRRAIRTVLNPLLDEEKKIEAEEIALEQEEAKIGLATDKQVVEKKRWSVQDRRKEVEKKKWIEEDKLTKIEAAIQEQTKKYRALLDTEEAAENRLNQIKIESATNKNG